YDVDTGQSFILTSAEDRFRLITVPPGLAARDAVSSGYLTANFREPTAVAARGGRFCVGFRRSLVGFIELWPAGSQIPRIRMQLDEAVSLLAFGQTNGNRVQLVAGSSEGRVWVFDLVEERELKPFWEGNVCGPPVRGVRCQLTS